MSSSEGVAIDFELQKGGDGMEDIEDDTLNLCNKLFTTFAPISELLSTHNDQFTVKSSEKVVRLDVERTSLG